MEDIRWKQRFVNYKKAFAQLQKAFEVLYSNEYSEDEFDLLREGLIQRFEYTHELAWKVLKDYAEFQGYSDEIRGSRDAFRYGLQVKLINDDVWLDSIADRNITSHSYDSETADNVFTNIENLYFPLFKDFEKSIEKCLE